MRRRRRKGRRRKEEKDDEIVAQGEEEGNRKIGKKRNNIGRTEEVGFVSNTRTQISNLK